MRAALAIAFAVGVVGVGRDATGQTLLNAHVRAEFDARGLRALTDSADHHRYGFEADGFSVTVGNETLGSGTLGTPTRDVEPQRVTYRYASGTTTVVVRYELRPDWRFVSKQIEVRVAGATDLRMREVELFRATFEDSPTDIYEPPSARANLQTGVYGAAVRFDSSHSLLIVAQNPFLHTRHEGRALALRYAPDMDWKSAYGAFVSDRGLIAPVRLSGRRATGEHDTRVASGFRYGDRRAGRSGGRGVHRHGARVSALSTDEAAERLRRLVRERLPDRRRHNGRTRRVPPDHRPGGGVRRAVRALCAVELRALASRGQRRRLELGARPLARTWAEDPAERMEPAIEPRSVERPGDARLRAQQAGRVARLRVPGAAVRAESRMARALAQQPSAQEREPLEPRVAGLAHRGAGRIPPAHRDRRLRIRPHVPHVRGQQSLRAVVGLAAGDGGAAPARSRHRDRRSSGVSPVRPVELARGELSAPDLPRRAAGELHAVP